jgi:hypothetical protein
MSAGTASAPGPDSIASQICGSSPLAQPIVLSDVILPILTRAETLKPGRTWTTHVADPLAGLFNATIQVRVDAEDTVEIGGQSVKAWRMTERAGSLSTTAWYDEQGRLLRRELGHGLSLVRLDDPQTGRIGPDQLPPLKMPPPLSRAWIKEHVNPELANKSLAELLPPLPRL